jgi:hypothetical protein
LPVPALDEIDHPFYLSRLQVLVNGENQYVPSQGVLERKTARRHVGMRSGPEAVRFDLMREEMPSQCRATS